MNSRERTFLTLQHKQTDRIPIDFWATSSVIQMIENHCHCTYTEFLDNHDIDLRYIEGPAYIGPKLAPGTDIWGVERKVISAGKEDHSESYSEVFDPPLMGAETEDDIENYSHWPHPDMFDYSIIEQQCDKILAGERIVVFQGDRLNRVAQLKPAMYLRGPDTIFMDLVLNPKIAQAIFNKIKIFYLVYLERILQASKGKIDIVLTGDDFGAQQGLLLKADMWRTYLKPGFAEYLNLIRNYKTISMHHSCGSVVDIIPDMIECRLDILQSIQPEAAGMSLANLKSKFGNKMCYQGGISIQKTMPFGSTNDIEREVQSIAQTVGSNGGYIFCTSHNIQADTPIEKIIDLLSAYKKFGSN